MKKWLLACLKTAAFIAVLLPVGFYGYDVYAKNFAPKAPCTVPIQYKLGSIDPRFGISSSELLDDIHRAGGLWSDAIGRQLFEYNPQGSLTISLIYDKRQETTQQEVVLNSAITQKNQTAASMKAQINTMQASYKQAQQDYTNDLALFKQARDAYNLQTDYWNAHGGAPSDQYTQLTAQKNNLIARQDALERERQDVNALADRINTLIASYNSVIGNINSYIQTINTDGLTGTQFEEGVYISDRNGKRINIFQFSTKTAFIRVLAHELGHALQLSHDAGADSIMNAVNHGKTLSLTVQDVQELKTACKIN
ncbi:MAG: matrixin family metalloprotease [Candidatus Parcubacteria bacterium]|nr:matrixin family metalloprotease [Candidatus Parcubacteria bacterium]